MKAHKIARAHILRQDFRASKPALAAIPEFTNMSVSLSLKNICRRYIKDNEEFMAVNNVNLDVQPGEFLTFLGPSGCGKTTTLRMIAGFETPTSG